MKVEKARIGSGQGYIWTGAGLFALAGFVAMAATGGASEAAPLAAALAILAFGLVALGFWKGLFSKIELRLMDIQASLSPATESAVRSAGTKEGEPSPEYLG